MRAYLTECMQKQVPASFESYSSYVQKANLKSKQLSLSFRAGQAALQTFAAAVNMIVLAGLSMAIEAAVTAFSNWVNRVDIANEAMSEAVDEYESAISALESTNSELDEQNRKMDELLSKEKLTYVEEGQLDELKEITKELTIQQDIDKRKEKQALDDAAKKTVDAYDKQYGSFDISDNLINLKLEQSRTLGYFPNAEDEDDITGNIAIYLRAKEIFEDAQSEYETAKQTNSGDVSQLAENVQYCMDAVTDASERISDNITDLQEKQLGLQDAYQIAKEKQKEGNTLSSLDNDVIETYEAICGNLKLIYEYTAPEEWNQMEAFSIFSTQGLEKSKDELIEMAADGTLTRESLMHNKNLWDAVQQSNFIVKENQDNIDAFCEWLTNYADTLDNAMNYVSDSSFADYLNIDYYAETKDRLLSLAKSGELTPETLSSTEEYAKLLNDTKTSAEDAAIQHYGRNRISRTKTCPSQTCIT